MEELNQSASALAVLHGPREKSDELTASQNILMTVSGHSAISRFEGLGTMFGEAPRRKVLCSCGAIAEIDSAMASRKKGLGKVVECIACRNRRIADEMETLNAHFNGEGRPEDDQ